MPVSPARAAAFEILLRIETTEAYASELLHFARFAKLSPADHGLLTELVMGVLRWRGVLDKKITERSSQSLTKLDVEVLTALRLGVYQILFLDRVPRHAAVNESVELVKSAHKRSAAGLVNALLRKIGDDKERLGTAKDRDSFPLDHSTAHPQWLVERWVRFYGSDAAGGICAYDQAAPRSVVHITNAALLARLQDEGIQIEPGNLLSTAFRVKAGDITRSKAFRERRLTIQDEASQLVALLVGRGEKILDCCAAPGGKTRIIAEQNPESTVVAMELHPQRSALLRKLVIAGNVHVVAGDARKVPLGGNFDRILVDAPCSGTGTLARNPEIKWRLRPEDLPRLQVYQLEILTAAMKLLAPGGTIVYSTCSLEPEENQDVIEKALADDASFRVVNCRDALEELRARGELVWDGVESLMSGPYLRTIPGVHPCDGFFAAIVAKE